MKNAKLITASVLALAGLLVVNISAHAATAKWSGRSGLSSVDTGYSYKSQGDIYFDDVLVFTHEDIEMLSKGIQANYQDIQYLTAQQTNVIEGFTATSSSKTITNALLKNATSVQVNYHDPTANINPAYVLDPAAGTLKITGIASGVVVDNIIIYHGQ